MFLLVKLFVDLFFMCLRVRVFCLHVYIYMNLVCAGCLRRGE